MESLRREKERDVFLASRVPAEQLPSLFIRTPLAEKGARGRKQHEP